MTTTASTRSSRSPDAMTGALRGSGRTAALRLAADTAQVLGDTFEAAAARSSSRPARTRVRWVPVGGVGRARRPGGGGTLCLALPTPRTDSSGAQGLWKVNLQPNHS